MRYRNIIITLGFIILVLSTDIIGVPVVWRELVLRLATFAIIVLAYLAGNERKIKAVPAESSTSDSTSDSNL